MSVKQDLNKKNKIKKKGNCFQIPLFPPLLRVSPHKITNSQRGEKYGCDLCS